MLYEIKNATISMNGNEILSHFNFRMVDGDKIGIVGRNGSGKTTFLKFLMGEAELDYNDDNTFGEVIKTNDLTPGYLSQISFKNTEATVYDELLKAFEELIKINNKINDLNTQLEKQYDEKKAVELNNLIDFYNNNGGLTYEKELKAGFVKFGFEMSDLDKKISEFSGGQTTKIALLKLLLMKPSLLILDEPTNHLDIDAIEWMEEYLKNYKKTLIVVSHDRMFLDNVCNIIYEVEHKIMTKYVGNYSEFLEQKQINYELKMAEYNNNLKEIERLTKLADRFRYKATKAKMVKSKDKMIDKLKSNTFKPLNFENQTFNKKIKPIKEGGKVVLRCTDLVVGYDGKPISKVNVVVNKGDRLGIVGKNGTGKSTFLKTIVDNIKKISGEYYFGHEIEYEYFDQKVAESNSTDTIFDDFSKLYPSYSNEEIRKCLGAFLFNEMDINKKVCDLSGGEKVRLSFAKLFEKRPNLLILDEPTNHLDILGKESLENIIANYTGTVIFVSHDRYFTKKVANKILLFEDNKTLFFMSGYEDYEYYEDKKNGRVIDDKTNFDSITSSIYDIKKEEVGIDYSELEVYDKYRSLSEAEELAKKENEPLQNIDEKQSSKDAYLDAKEKSKIDRKIKKIEEEIEKIENNIVELNEQLENEDIQSDFEKLYEIQSKIDDNNKKIEKLMNEWEELHA